MGISKENDVTDFPSSLTSKGCEGCRSAPERDLEFDFAYQPIIDLRDRSVFAHEALVRGVHGEGAMSVLGQVNDQNRYRFDQLCRTRAIATAAPELCIRSTLEAARQHNFPLERLIFETVESEQLESNRHLTHVLRQYKEYGFKTAIDDFGAGHSGLGLLADFQPDIIKLDMALVRNVHQDRVRQAIVRGVVGLCKELGITVIAEGIEHAQERDFLADCGIYLMQGYWFAKPAFKALAPIPGEAWS
jgi:EAL domain-containing protein (putative c-di-GMP-specific phosphodiesterase class I)